MFADFVYRHVPGLVVERGRELSRVFFEQAGGLEDLDDRACAGHDRLVAGLPRGMGHVCLEGSVEHSLPQLHGRDYVLEKLAGRDDLTPPAADFRLIPARERAPMPFPGA